jgi:hypothetical protein
MSRELWPNLNQDPKDFFFAAVCGSYAPFEEMENPQQVASSNATSEAPGENRLHIYSILKLLQHQTAISRV